MKKAVCLLLLLPLLASADPDNESFESCAAGGNSQDCHHINEANDRMVDIEEAAVALEIRVTALEALTAHVCTDAFILGAYLVDELDVVTTKRITRFSTFSSSPSVPSLITYVDESSPAAFPILEGQLQRFYNDAFATNTQTGETFIGTCLSSQP